MNALRHVKPAVRELAAYTLAVREAPVKINQNENPHELPDALKRRVVEQALARPWGRYPDFDPIALQRALAASAGWTADGILVGNGSNELIEALLRVTVGDGTPVVIPQPTFTLYALLTRILGGRVVPVELGPGLDYVPSAIADARRATQSPLTIVCSPNNPTGSVMRVEDVDALCRESDGLVAIDQAYVEFSDVSVVPLLARHANLVVLRTFSKAMAMAGLRVGYLLGDPALVREVNKARLPYNLNVISQLAAEAALEDGDALARSVADVVRERERVAAALAGRGDVTVYPSAANFLLVELRDHAPRVVFESLYARGVLVRDVSSNHRLSRCLRVSIGTRQENDVFLEALSAALAAPTGAHETTGSAGRRATASLVPSGPVDEDRGRRPARGSARGRDAAPPRINKGKP